MSTRPRYVGQPHLRLLSLGAGVQSSCLLLLSAHGVLPTLDGAIFADTGWESAAVHAHLDRLENTGARPAGIPIHRVSAGNIRVDALDPSHRFASMPLFVRQPNGRVGLMRRQCTAEYKIKPIKAAVRQLLGAPRRPDGSTGRVPAGRWAEQWIGISTDEVHRAKDSDVRYLRHVFPLLDLDGTRADCLAYLTEFGLADTPRSACVGCPFHSDAFWRDLRDNHADDWADAVTFDRAIRHGNARATTHGRPLLGRAFLHRSCLPLDQAPLDSTPSDPEPQGCSPWSCRSGDPVDTPITA